jgi:ketosteroid isomerase-like protein
MRRLALAGIALVLAGCGGAANAAKQQTSTDDQRLASMYEIEQIEHTWHKAASTHDLDLMMSLWAPDATFTYGTNTLTGAGEIRTFFATKAKPFQPGTNWLSETPAYKIRITVNGDTGTLYFECHYVDLNTKKVVAVVASDQEVQKIGGKWLIVHSTAATPLLEP